MLDSNNAWKIHSIMQNYFFLNIPLGLLYILFWQNRSWLWCKDHHVVLYHKSEVEGNFYNFLSYKITSTKIIMISKPFVSSTPRKCIPFVALKALSVESVLQGGAAFVIVKWTHSPITGRSSHIASTSQLQSPQFLIKSSCIFNANECAALPGAAVQFPLSRVPTRAGI